MSRIKGQEKGKKGIRFLSLPPKPPLSPSLSAKNSKRQDMVTQAEKDNLLRRIPPPFSIPRGKVAALVNCTHHQAEVCADSN